MKAVFLRAVTIPVDEKADALKAAVIGTGSADSRFEVDLDSFRQVPRSPFAYWVSDALRASFLRLTRFESTERTVKQGLATADDFRFVRLWTEANTANFRHKWFPYAKGGNFSPFYADVLSVVDWEDDGYRLRNFYNNAGRQASRTQNKDYYFRAGLSWPLRGIRFSAQIVPEGCIFSIAGKMAFAPKEELLWFSAIFNSLAFDSMIAFFAGKVGGVQYEVGLIQNVPVAASPGGGGRNELDSLALAAWKTRRASNKNGELFHAFVLPGLLLANGPTLQSRAGKWAEQSVCRQQTAAAIQAEIDNRCFALYGIGPEDRQSIEAGFGVTGDDAEGTDEDEDADDDTPEEIDAAPMVASLLSWCVGVAFGRFDLRLATGARPLPPEPEPFDPLPTCSPGMLTGDDGLPLDSPPQAYPIAFPADGILVDDPGHPRDLLQAVRGAFEHAFLDPNARWHEAAEILGLRDLRPWFARAFFAEHLNRYKKSRRWAPIYWQLATPSAFYSVWLYVHRATADTLFRVLNDFVDPKLAHERARLDKLIKDAGPNPGRRERDEIDAQQGFVGELVAMRAEVARVAPLWKPDLDDGVILNFAPLWRLVPHQRTWQNECRKAWDRLQSGDYDWAHLAMHLWPERVVPKCAEDRSLAIAHGLEDTFWFEDEAGKWQPRRVADGLVARLITERTSGAVKAALKELLTAAPPAGGGTTRGRKPPRPPSAPRTPPSPRESAAASRPSAPAVDEATLSAVQAAIARMSEGASKADVQAATGLSDADWNKAIAALLERGSITRTGEKRGTRYHATDEEG